MASSEAAATKKIGDESLSFHEGSFKLSLSDLFIGEGRESLLILNNLNAHKPRHTHTHTNTHPRTSYSLSRCLQ